MPSQSEPHRDEPSRLRFRMHNHRPKRPTGGYGDITLPTAHLFAMEEPDVDKRPISPALSSPSPPSPPSRPSTAEAAGNEVVTTPDASSSTSRKRSVSSRSNASLSEEPASKKICTTNVQGNATTQSPPPSWDDLITAVPYTKPLFADEPFHLLQRSAALILDHVGFDGASKEAMESICAQATACMYPGLHCTSSLLTFFYRCGTVSVICHRIYALFSQRTTYTT